jgi:NADPH:quinone reductase-like Zn-dependent oxidoreductase
MEDATTSKRKNLTLHWIQALTPNILKLEHLQKAQTDILKKGAILADAGKLSVQIGQVFLLKQVAKAMDLLESGHHHGRIVLSMDLKED